MSSDPQPRKKPGFFSRLFSVTEAPSPEALEEPLADEAPAPPPDTFHEAAAESGGLLKRFFGSKDKPAEPAPPTPAPVAPEAAPSRGWFSRLSERLGRTRQGLVDNIRSVLGMSGKLDEETIEELEAVLIQSDVSVETTRKLIDRMKVLAKLRPKEEMGQEALVAIFRQAVLEILENSAPGFDPRVPEDGSPYVVMVVGVNGVGKTTTIAKMAQRCTRAGLRTMLVAGDTFRAAAVEQLEIWAQRTGCEFARAPHGADPAALCYDAMQKARARQIQVVFVDTAGRLHTKSGLMDELGKIARVIDRQIPGAPHEILLVLDATTGQNALQQVKIFATCVPVSGLVLTKLDGTAKGGVLLSILDMHRIPITLIGVGESADDLRDFDPAQFAAALFGEPKAEAAEQSAQ